MIEKKELSLSLSLSHLIRSMMVSLCLGIMNSSRSTSATYSYLYMDR